MYHFRKHFPRSTRFYPRVPLLRNRPLHTFLPTSAYQINTLQITLCFDHSYSFHIHALLNCSFRKNTANPTGTASWNNNATQNHASLSPSLELTRKFGNTGPGPTLLGAVALATIVVREPRICAAMSVKRM